MSARRRSGCSPVALILAAILALGGLLAIDRIAHRQAEQAVARSLHSQMQLTDQPEIAIHGFPFLTQVIANRFDRVDLSGTGITAGTPDRPLLVDRMSLKLRDVITAERYQQITAGRLDGTAYVTWGEISRQIGSPVTPQEGGRVRVDFTAALYGQQVDLVLSARPVLDVATQEVDLTEPQVIIARYQVPDSVVERIAAEYAPAVPITLPLSLRASSLTIGEDHLELGLTGDRVNLMG